MISEVDLRDWDPVEMKKILTGIEFNYVYNGRESPFGRRDMDVIMAFLTKAEEVRKNLVPQIPAIFKPLKEGEKGVGYGPINLITSGYGGRSVYTEDEFFHPND